VRKNRLLMCYGKTCYTPGRYLEDGLRRIGWHIDHEPEAVDFERLDMTPYAAVLFVDNPARPPVRVNGIERVKIPKLLWITHGEHRLEISLLLDRAYRPDMVLMAHSLHLAHRFSAPVHFFPFAMAEDLFNCTEPLSRRSTDISFIKSSDTTIDSCTIPLSLLKIRFGAKHRLALRPNAELHQAAPTYGNSKLVINVSTYGGSSIGTRIFEGMGCGALVLSEYAPGMEYLFEDRMHLAIFRTRDEMLERADYYLKHPDEAQRIAAAGYRHLLSAHTYRHRAREIANIIAAIS